MRKHSTLLLTLLLPTLLFADAGSTVMPSLKLAVSPRAQGFGGGGSALLDDGAYAALNPAAILNLEQDRVFFSHAAYAQDTRHEYLNATLFYGKTPVGVSLWYHDMGLAPITTDGSDYDERNTFHSYDAAFMITAGRVYKNVKLGLTLKGLRESIWDEAANGMALDLGAIAPLPIKGLTAAAALTNLGFLSSFIDESYPLTRTLRLGAGYVRELPWWNLKGRAALDLHWSNDGVLTAPLGIEVVKGPASFRAGYALLHDTQTLSAGVSIEYLRVIIDYAYVRDADDFGTPHYFALSVLF